MVASPAIRVRLRGPCSLLALLFPLLSGCEPSRIEDARTALDRGDFVVAERLLAEEMPEGPTREPWLSIEARTALQRHAFEAGVGLEIPDSTFAKRILQAERLRSIDTLYARAAGSLWSSWCEETMRRGDTAFALRRLRAWTKHHPTDPEAWASRALREFHAGNWSEADSSFRKAVDLDTTDLVARFNLGMFLWKRDNPHGALETWLQVLERDPGHPSIGYWVGRAKSEALQ